MSFPDEDTRLLAAIVAGDRRALHTLYTTYHGRLIRFLLRVTRDPALAEEILNDTLWIVWRNASSFRAESRVSTWITGIAYRRALKLLAADKRHRQLHAPSPDQDENTLNTASIAMPFTQQIETGDWVETALDQLSPEHRLTLELAYFLGESCEDIALITDCPIGTVKTRLHHARLRMRRHLEQAGGQTSEGYP
jgi:RNA polymerase sigma-70 factor, ECF subfamily